MTPNRFPQNPTEHLNKIVKDPRFLAEYARPNTKPEIALGKTAAALVLEERAENNDRLSIEGHMNNIYSTLPEFIGAQRQLDRLENRRNNGGKVLRSEEEPHLEKVIPYNHAIKECMDSNQRLTMQEVIDFVTKSTLALTKSPDDARYAAVNTREIIIGMLEEMYVESALWLMPGVESVRQANISEEMRGIDLIAELADGSELCVDAKTSEVGEQKALAGYRSGGSIPLWSGIDRRELGNTFKPNQKLVEKARDRIYSTLFTDRSALLVNQ